MQANVLNSAFTLEGENTMVVDVLSSLQIARVGGEGPHPEQTCAQNRLYKHSRRTGSVWEGPGLGPSVWKRGLCQEAEAPSAIPALTECRLLLQEAHG